MSNADITTGLQVAAAAGAALAPLAGPQAVLADQLLTQGLAFWAEYQAKKAAGLLTMADVETAAAKTGVDLAQLAADVAALG